MILIADERRSRGPGGSTVSWSSLPHGIQQIRQGDWRPTPALCVRGRVNIITLEDVSEGFERLQGDMSL